MRYASREAKHMRHFLLLLSLLVSLPSAAADRNGGYSILGRGTISCGALIKAHDERDKYSVVFVSEWVNGYLTAINLTTPGVNDLTEGLDLLAREQWLLKYCREKPLDSVAQATEMLVRELKQRKQ